MENKSAKFMVPCFPCFQKALNNIVLLVLFSVNFCLFGILGNCNVTSRKCFIVISLLQ